MFELDGPHIAFNDSRVQVTSGPLAGAKRMFTMWKNFPVDIRTPCERIINDLATIARSTKKRRLRHAVLSGHGFSGVLEVGEGFYWENVSLFAAWKGLVDNRGCPKTC